MAAMHRICRLICLIAADDATSQRLNGWWSGLVIKPQTSCIDMRE